MSTVPFEEIRDAVVNEVTAVTNAYAWLRHFVFPVSRQQLLCDHYPLFVFNLADAFRAQVLITVCRLFDPKNDPRQASLTTFLRRIPGHHAADKNVDPVSIKRRRNYEQRIPRYRAEIGKRWKLLVVHRNAYLAHRDLTKIPPDMTYRFVRQSFQRAQTIVAGYYSAYLDTARLFDVPGAKQDAKRLLEWCRFDKYERHFKADPARLRRRLRDKGRP